MKIDGRCSCAVLSKVDGLPAYVCAVLNAYEAGQGVNYHSDNEAQLLNGAPVSTYTVMGHGMFSVRYKGAPAEVFKVQTTPGMLVEMIGEKFQGSFEHAVDQVGSRRLSVSVRLICGSGDAATYTFKNKKKKIRIVRHGRLCSLANRYISHYKARWASEIAAASP